MKLKKTLVACALAFGASPLLSNAAALTSPYQTPDLEIYLSGASAPDTYLATILTSVFDSGYYTFKDDGGVRPATSTGTAYNAYYGHINDTDVTIPASLRGKNVRLIKRSAGGSVWGVNPVAREQGIKSLHISNAVHPTTNAAACEQVGTTTTYTCSVHGDDANSAATGNMVPDFGVSDVAPNMFKAPLNVEYGKEELTVAETSGLTVKALNALLMGLPVTNSVPTSYFSKANFGAMLSGNITSWSALGIAVPTKNSVSRDNVIVCRRHPGSGTQASYNWYFNNFPCTTASKAGSGESTPAVLTGSEPTGGAGTSGNPYTLDPSQFHALEHSASGDVRKCLYKAQNGGTHTFQSETGEYYSINFGTDADAGGYGAIGTLSVDSHGKETSGTEGGWTFRNLDGMGNLDAGTISVQTVTGTTGVAPTQANLLSGKYDFAVELTMQYKSSRIGTTGMKFDFIDTIVTRGGAAARQTNATAAVYPNATPTVDASGALTSSNISRGTRSGNMCKPWALQY